MKKLKEIGYLIIDGASAMFRLCVAIIIPFVIGESFLRFVDVTEMEGISLVQQLVVVILLLWVMDVLVRPIVSKLLLGSLSDLGKLFIIQPSEKTEEITNARYTATAKDA